MKKEAENTGVKNNYLHLSETSAKSSRVIVWDYWRQCQYPIPYLKIIGPAMEQSDWLILVLSHLVILVRTNLVL